jgi:hypothetical protein
MVKGVVGFWGGFAEEKEMKKLLLAACVALLMPFTGSNAGGAPKKAGPKAKTNVTVKKNKPALPDGKKLIAAGQKEVQEGEKKIKAGKVKEGQAMIRAGRKKIREGMKDLRSAKRSPR